MASETTTSPATGFMTPPDLPVIPPPWKLSGDGWVVFYSFPPDHPYGVVERDELAGKWRGGTGAIAWMNYKSSPVGAYSELLYIPGKFEATRKGKTKKFYSISQIFVSSWESVVSGRANWGIPKDRADFRVETLPTGEDHLVASIDGAQIAELTAKAGLFRMPVNTGLFPVTLMQKWQGQTFFIKLAVSAGIEWLTSVKTYGDGVHIPDLSGINPLGAIKLDKFKITFPAPEIAVMSARASDET